MNSELRIISKPNSQAWYRPTFSPEHGVYVMLLVSCLTGAAAAQNWTFSTTLAAICAFCGFQAEHPLVLQIKQRRSLKPRFLVWGGIYASLALAIASALSLRYSVLLWLFGGAIAAFIVDAVAVFYREQKSVINELITFASVCLSAPLAYVATTGAIAPIAIGLWGLNTLFFGSAIFTVKLRKPKTTSLIPGLLYHAIATLIVAALYWFGILPLLAALAFAVVLLKFGLIVIQQQWYCTAPIQFVALLETISAFSFLIIVAMSVLPVRLTTF
jgi:hypothetical protein